MSFKLEKVLVLDGVDIVCENKLKEAGIQVTSHAKLSKEELIREINQHDALIVRSATKVTADVLQGSTRLKVIGRAGTGVDNIDVDAATKMGILVMNTPGGNTLSAAEHTCALICALSRSIPQACASLKTGAWDRKKFMGNELSGKTLAVIGLGRIGREVCDRMKSFGMTAIGYDPLVSPETAASWGIDYFPLEEIWPQADYITVHTPLIPQTRYLVNEGVLKRCRPSVKIVNVARGGIVEEKALLNALDNSTCGGAALDVFEEEPPKNLSLVQHPKVICTPHLGANTFEAQKRVAVEIADQFIAMSAGTQLTGVVNAPALMEAAGDTQTTRPWVELATSLGKISAALVVGPGEETKLTVKLHGNAVSGLSRLMTPVILKGFLEESSTKGNVNLINSPMLAKEAKVNINVTSVPAAEVKDTLNLSNSIEVLVQRGTSECSLIGSIAGGRPELLAINGCIFSPGVTLMKTLLFFTTPSPHLALGQLGMALREASLLALLSSSTSTGKEGWVIARTAEKKEVSLANIPEAKLVARIHC